MIVYGMTESEIVREVLADMGNAFRYEDRNSNQFRRAVIKAARFPVRSEFVYRSPRKNTWLVLREARTKKEYGDNCRITFVTTHDTPHGIYAIMVSWVEGQPQLILYPPHFFSRFRERMKLSESGKNLMLRFFRFNSSYVHETIQKKVNGDQYVVEIAGSTLEGVALGLVSTEGNVLFKTFVTYDMLKGEQIAKYLENEKIRKEIHDAPKKEPKS